MTWLHVSQKGIEALQYGPSNFWFLYDRKQPGNCQEHCEWDGFDHCFEDQKWRCNMRVPAASNSNNHSKPLTPTEKSAYLKSSVPENPSVRPLSTLRMKCVSSAFSRSSSSTIWAVSSTHIVPRCAESTYKTSYFLGLIMCFPLYVRLTIRKRPVNDWIQVRYIFKLCCCSELGSIMW